MFNARDNEISLINTLARLILDRDPEFTPVAPEDMKAMSDMELNKLHRQYHELAYAPPPRR
jgi:hypothetical protein